MSIIHIIIVIAIVQKTSIDRACEVGELRWHREHEHATRCVRGSVGGTVPYMYGPLVYGGGWIP